MLLYNSETTMIVGQHMPSVLIAKSAVQDMHAFRDKNKRGK